MNPVDLLLVVASLNDDDRQVLHFITSTHNSGVNLFGRQVREHFESMGWTRDRLTTALVNLASVGLIVQKKPGAA